MPLLRLDQTSLDKTGSDAMNAAGDYSAAYCIIYTDSDHSGHGMVGFHLTYFGTILLTHEDRPSPSAAATKLSALRFPSSPRSSPARTSTSSPQTGARPGATSSQTASCVGSVQRRASSISPWAPSLTPYGISGPRPSASPYGASSPT